MQCWNILTQTKQTSTQLSPSNSSVRLTTHSWGWFEHDWSSVDPGGIGELLLQQACLLIPSDGALGGPRLSSSQKIYKKLLDLWPLTSLFELSFLSSLWLFHLHTTFLFSLTFFSFNFYTPFFAFSLTSISFSSSFNVYVSLCCCPAVLRCVVCRVWCQRPWAHKEKEKWGRRTDGGLGRGGGSLDASVVTRCHEQTSTNTCQTDVVHCRRGCWTPKCLHHAVALLTCINKLILVVERRLFLWDGGMKCPSVCLSTFSAPPALSGYKPSSPQSFHKIESHMAYCWLGP